MGQARKLRVCYVQSYRAPDYIRGRSLVAALQAMDGIELTLAVNTSRGVLRYVETLRALWQVRKRAAPDVYVVGFRGHEIAPAVLFLARGAPVVLDVLMSPSSALLEERKHGWPGRFAGLMLRPIERAILHGCGLLLTDTALQSRHIARAFDLEEDAVLAVPVGALEPMPPAPCGAARNVQDESFNALFYGSFLPLHGIGTLLRAAAMVADLPIRFDFIGGTREQARALRTRLDRDRVHYTHRPWVPQDTLLADDIPAAGLCLGGPFGATPQAMRVVTGKTSQCLALGKATVVGAIDEDVGFRDRDNCLLVPQGDPAALAEALRWSFDHRDLLPGIGLRGRDLYLRNLSPVAITRRLEPRLMRLAGREAQPA